MSELKSCPFCGGEGIIWPFREHPFYLAICKDGCGCQLGDFKTREEAIQAWNTRAERTCEPTEEYCCPCGQDLVSCDTGIGANGGAVELDPPILFNYCPNCGVKVIKTI